MKRLLIDLEICTECKDCTISCSYFYHPDNNGLTYIWEIANFALACRKCEDEPCVKACPNEALEKQEDKILKRYSMRCTSCKTCVWACPFGTIYPETIPYLISRCDVCIGRLEGKDVPECVTSCKDGGIKYGDFDEDIEKGHFKLTDNIVIHSIHWRKEEQEQAEKPKK